MRFNVYGDANAIFRTADLRSVGGFVADRATYCHDWETFVKLVHAGRRIGVVPEYLFYYRRRADGMSAVMTDKRRNTYDFNQRMITSFAAGNGGEATRRRGCSGRRRRVIFCKMIQSKTARPRSLYGAARRLAGVGKRVWKRAFSRLNAA